MSRIVESTTDTKAEVDKTIGSFKPKVKVEEKPAAPADEKAEVRKAGSGSVEATDALDKPEHSEISDDKEESEESEEKAVEEGSDKEGEEKKPGKNGFKKRIDKLTKQRAEFEQRAIDAEKRAVEAEKRAAGQKPDAKVEAPKAAEGKPTADKFKNHDDYVEALTDWKLQEAKKADDTKSTQERMRSEREKTINDHNSRVKEFSKSKTDFNEVLSDVDHISFPPALADIVLNHEKGPELMYAMAKDPENYERITKLPPLAMAREVGKIEARLDSPSAKANESKQTTNAPAPVRSIGGSAVIPRKTLGAAQSHADYVAARKAGAKK